eukprot:CAMPEP_0201523756 /NCGR_PEP_ID=MMETSP0161_2-20130828/20905_1 /ASSEMBLY_ACC=CAM_ASM_000251 /TAXON_ID=180227 /ORGANISM="Neoparamoeba aestuarina, Strain SoJaBio B1-5/56/2" /LENGTH=46 /DNA_ID= /DNA_START= /DNA_END= /DNA_ORIENTATION=
MGEEEGNEKKGTGEKKGEGEDLLIDMAERGEIKCLVDEKNGVVRFR